MPSPRLALLATLIMAATPAAARAAPDVFPLGSLPVPGVRPEVRLRHE